ncbi:hypothetical protein ACLI1A_13165 [Flavobacterium sp. RHBU_3]|uniref:hypothetical protein n=1 Tax=Flavobacterium sp. RHBU_3 TaxID=3391184 RepID=UPI003984E237
MKRIVLLFSVLLAACATKTGIATPVKEFNLNFYKDKCIFFGGPVELGDKLVKASRIKKFPKGVFIWIDTSQRSTNFISRVEVFERKDQKKAVREDLKHYADTVHAENQGKQLGYLINNSGKKMEFLTLYYSALSAIEAKLPDGTWKQINTFAFCGNGFGYQYSIPSKKAAVFVVDVPKGAYKVKYRINIEDYYSNEFDGTIDCPEFAPNGG